MSENKFIKHLKGEDTAKSVLEIKNQRTTTSFANMPLGTSNANDVYSDHRGNAIGVLRGTDNWKVADINSLINATTVYGDGRDVTGSYNVSSNSLWVDAIYTFTGPKTFAPNTKFVLKLCGERLSNTEDIVPFSLVITIGNAIVTKSFAIREHAFEFSEEFVIDFTESNSALIKCVAGTTMRVQLLCGSADASATIYTGMTVFTALQRRVDGDTVVSDKKTFDEIVEDVEDLEEYVDDTFVRLDGTSIMTGPLKMRASISFQCAIAPYWDGVGFFKLNDDNSVTLIASIDTSDGFLPWVTNTYNIGSSLKKWKNLYLAGKAYVATINNGSDITVPNSTGEMLVNTATNSTSLSIFGNAASGINTINIGRYTTPAGVNSIMIGNYSKAGEGAMAFGNGAEAASYGFAYLGKAAARYAYQIGRGTNSESYTLYVGWGTNENYKMLDGTTGFIPDARISSNIARMSDVELAARSGRMITDQGVWYAKMYSETVPPAAENGTNYADFSQVDGQGNPIIVTYNRVNGAWVQDQTITPPAEYDGYVPITSKIWDIAEQDGQQGGRVLWNHQSKEFTPYPQIVSFDGQDITNSTFSYGTITYSTFSGTATLSGTSTVVMPQDPTGDQIVNKDYVDNHIPTGNFYHPDLFDWKWADHQLNDVQWLRGDTFSWQSGAVYEAAYQHLVDDIDGKTLQSETIGSTTIQFYLADDGHKICPASEESNVATIYATTGVAWYYIIDTVNERFKLPHGKHNKYTETLGVVGNGTAISVTYDGTNDATLRYLYGNNTGNFGPGTTAAPGSAVGSANTAWGGSTWNSKALGLSTNAENSGLITTPISQDTDQYKYLYFYVGEFTQTAIENTAGLNAELFNGKADVSTVAHVVTEFQAPTAQNNYTWYRKYADGWVEQGGIWPHPNPGTYYDSVTITLPVVMADANYSVILSNTGTNTTAYAKTVSSKTTTEFVCTSGGGVSKYNGFDWEVKGMVA